MEKKTLFKKNFEKFKKADQSVAKTVTDTKKLKSSRKQDNFKLNDDQQNKNFSKYAKIVKISSKLPPKPKKAEKNSNSNCENIKKKKVSFFAFVTVYEECDSFKNKIYSSKLHKSRF